MATKITWYSSYIWKVYTQDGLIVVLFAENLHQDKGRIWGIEADDWTANTLIQQMIPDHRILS